MTIGKGGDIATAPSRSAGDLTTTDETIYRRAGLGGRTGIGARTALVVIDMQRGFTDAAHPLGFENEEFVTNVAALLSIMRERGDDVVFTVIEYPTGTYSCRWFDKMPELATFVRSSRWTEVDERVRPLDGEPVLRKTQASAVFGTDLLPALHTGGIDTVVLAGATSSGCVRATAVDLVSSGFRVLVPSDCVADRIPAAHEAAMFDIDAKYGDVVDLAKLRTLLTSDGTIDSDIAPERLSSADATTVIAVAPSGPCR